MDKLKKKQRFFWYWKNWYKKVKKLIFKSFYDKFFLIFFYDLINFLFVFYDFYFIWFSFYYYHSLFGRFLKKIFLLSTEKLLIKKKWNNVNLYLKNHLISFYIVISFKNFQIVIFFIIFFNFFWKFFTFIFFFSFFFSLLKLLFRLKNLNSFDRKFLAQ